VGESATGSHGDVATRRADGARVAIKSIALGAADD